MTRCPSKINGKSLLYVWHNLLLFFVQKTDANKLNSSILGVFKTLLQIYTELFAKITAYAAQKVKFSITISRTSAADKGFDYQLMAY